MVLKVVNPGDVLATCRLTLGLPPSGERNPGHVDDVFLAALLRHSAGFLCPCSGATLRSVAMESLQYLVVDGDLASRLEDIVETLTIGGDLLELTHATTDDPGVRGTWLFAAPPSYIIRQSGDIFLTGIVSDQDTYIPRALASRIRYDGCSRILSPERGEDLAGELSELGLQHISQAKWLKAPRAQAAEDLYADLDARLKAGSRSGSITHLQILDTDKPVRYYRGRWMGVKNQTGIFVARRPQEYGSPIWCFVELEAGVATRLLDFPLPRQRWRGCDAAWHLQMAIDHSRGKPQRYRRRRDEQNIYLDFFSPLPIWAQRRLMIIGRKAVPRNCLMSFRIPKQEAEEEERFLQTQLWLAPQDPEEAV